MTKTKTPRPKKTPRQKLYRVTDPNDNDGEGSTGLYAKDGFRSWVHEVFLEGYKRDVKIPSLPAAIEIVEGAGCAVEVIKART
jgi:hypothetical protein